MTLQLPADLLPAGPDPGARGDLTLGGSPAQSPLLASLAPALGSLVPSPANPARVLMSVNLAPSPAPNPSGSPQATARRSPSTKSPAAVRHRPMKTVKRSAPSPPPTPLLYEMTSMSRQLNTHPLSHLHVQSLTLVLVPGLSKPISLLPPSQAGERGLRSI